MNIFNCPKCQRATAPRWSEHRNTHGFDWYVCRSCRHAWRTLCDATGSNRKVIAESPRVDTLLDVNKSEGVMVKTACPACGRHAPVKKTMHREDGTWRRHVCTCGPYFSCQTAEGTTVHRRMKSTKAIDLAA